MSTYRKEGKDVIIFATADDHKEPSKIVLPEPEPQAGLILPNGEINWNCPCLGGMATGPCGVEFREAFSCFHNSEAEPKGSDCYEAFKTMHLCMAEYPQLYSRYDDDEDEEKGLISDGPELPLVSNSKNNEVTNKEKSVKKAVEEKPSEKKPEVRREPRILKPADEPLKIKANNANT